MAAGPSAARILGLPLLGHPPTDLVLASEDTTASGRRDGYVLRATGLPTHHRAVRHGVALTSAARTVVDVAREGSYEVVRWGGEDANNPLRLAARLRAAFARGLERQRGRRAS